jgi:uncharacterized protein YodC (DUF2158 family)
MAMRGQGSRARISRPAATGGTAMAFKVGDAVRLKSGGAQMIVSKLFKSPEGREMVQCTWFDKKPREHRAAFVMDSLEVAEATTRHLTQSERARGFAVPQLSMRLCRRRRSDDDAFLQ